MMALLLVRGSMAYVTECWSIGWALLCLRVASTSTLCQGVWMVCPWEMLLYLGRNSRLGKADLGSEMA